MTTDTTTAALAEAHRAAGAFPDADALTSEGAPLIALAEAHAVSDQATHGAGLRLVADLTAFEKLADAEFDEVKRSAKKTHELICAMWHKVKDPITAAKQALNLRLSKYEREEALRVRREKLEAEKAAKEAAEAEKAREVAAAKAAGDAELAKEIEREELPAPVVQAPVARVAKVKGVTGRSTWKAEVVDFSALVAWVALDIEGRVHFLEPCKSTIAAVARSQKSKLSIPGVKAVESVSRSVKS